ncbi:aminotransferase [Roseomonas marmotae]|uniref:Aminotransferase class III-fold pyridoxal phosphate-dependent enzyme n=1 Tax=Roseomonas marmotae TaxID=2768161 RepID=A0ABS3KFU7_9PROT|nr:aminotransferase [Roseomonas marmotae]MBO1075216.1 aminotransferase class III-fold pyridoxal phosphate-dependent enzyme [Roseomonas marmotae]QTI79677.1 aminotransferase class III-fold pyridoxal phosphate-dependent enzyme [Roseomonas marmotae]
MTLPDDAPRFNSAAARDIEYALHPYTNHKAFQESGPLTIQRGEGIRVFDDSGRDYIESVAGLWCASLGFANQRLADAAYRQMQKLPFYHAFGGRSHDPLIDLSEMLIQRAPPASGGKPFSKVFFANSGSEANDSAIKMIWFYNNAIGRPQKKKIIGRIRGYHGITVASGSVTGQPLNHKMFDLPIAGFHHVSCPHHYGYAEPGESEEAFATRLAQELEELILREGPETVAAFFAEPVMGAGGVIIPPATYYEKVQAVLRRHDVLLVADEVICGFGRTGNYWGCQSFGIQPDILTCAKQLSSAFLPISAVMISEQLYQGIAEGSDAAGTWAHGFTYSGHPVPAAVAIETLKIYDEMEMPKLVAERGAYLQKAMRERFAGHPLVGEVRGIGMIGAIELTADKASRTSFDPARRLGARWQALGLEHGVMMRVLVNESAAISPPLIISEPEIDEMLDRTMRALEALRAEI